MVQLYRIWLDTGHHCQFYSREIKVAALAETIIVALEDDETAYNPYKKEES